MSKSWSSYSVRSFLGRIILQTRNEERTMRGEVVKLCREIFDTNKILGS